MVVGAEVDIDALASKVTFDLGVPLVASCL